MKLTDEQKQYLLDKGYSKEDFRQIEQAASKIIYKVNGNQISRKKCIELLGVNTYLSGIARAAFHFTACQVTEDGVEIYFDAYAFFRSKDYFSPSVVQKTSPSLSRAKKLIDEFCHAEYDSPANFSDLSKIAIGYTTVTDAEIPIQCYANLVDFRIERYLEETLIESRQSNSLDEMITLELENLDFSDLIYVTDEEVSQYYVAEQTTSFHRYLVIAYHHFENGFDEKQDYTLLSEAEKAAQGYVNGTMECAAFKYDGAAVYDQQEQKYLRIYGDYPDEKAHTQANSTKTIDPEVQEHFIDHFYVIDNLEVRGVFSLKKYSSIDAALRAYLDMSSSRMKALGAMNTTKPFPGSLDFVQCKNGHDIIIKDYEKVDGWNNPEVQEVISKLEAIFQGNERKDGVCL